MERKPLICRRFLSIRFLAITAAVLARALPALGADLPASAWSDPPSKTLPQVLTTGTRNVQLMGVPDAQKMAPLTAKFKAGLAAHQDWFLGFLKEHDGKELPYHPNFGLTEDEYAELQRMLKDPLAPIAKGSLEVLEGEPGVLYLSSKSIAALNGIRIDLPGNIVETPFGTCATALYLTPEAPQRLPGEWDGYAWTRTTVPTSVSPEQLEAVSGDSVTFGIARRREDGLVVLLYEAKRFGGGQLIERADVLIALE